MRLLALSFSLIASSAMAQDLVYSDRDTDLCYQSAQEPMGCIGLSAAQCMEDTGYATVVEAGCYDRELQYWDRLLNANYRAKMAQAKENDRLNEGFGPSQAEALKTMQRAWIPFRDASCDYERSLWGGGTGGSPAQLNCLMTETARQAITLGYGAGD
ncbi:hypothetical protein TRP8649_02691 [Pelagimonas phthalicica]|uniref:Lysozyme inhibitor LprI-like N-terminal domain-containing protein n=1 Tax=Pelagimonas phthalicica TaxID=1037362 RepID=A0A238JFF8_9RHOB|nr:lysozyme inhibitor LprI family protein [Pelagimonas phthalicica]TDS91517.1 uncharacterized protein DUF1311 [Pelagimonas phthalicica]SMX28566.1 hypothetical protein TRP8649_02691 [Pelagimonas phthalicica]